MSILKSIVACSFVFATCGFNLGVANAQETVECGSHDYKYTECQAPLDNPQLIHQQSSSSCIVNRTWGFNPKTNRIWVSDGCAGVFADVDGYHYGRGDRFDSKARHYDERGHDNGKMAAGLVAAALIGAALDDSSDKKKKNKKHTTSNNWYSNSNNKSSKSGYNGCHGIGCTVDNPDQASNDAIDPRPSHDKEGNPNFDTKGNWIGCHGAGCDIDNPDTTD